MAKTANPLKRKGKTPVELASLLRTESDSTVSVVKYSTARNAANALDSLSARVHELEAAIKEAVAADCGQSAAMKALEALVNKPQE